MVTKASKRLHILRVLKRAGIPSCDLLHIYLALIRSVLEYVCVTWTNSIPVYLRDKIEMVQKRVMRILFPGAHYRDTLALAKCSRLDDRRDKLCRTNRTYKYSFFFPAMAYNNR